MRGQLKADQDFQVIKRFLGWACNIREALRKEETLPACSNFILTSFIPKLCSIHQKQTLSEDTGARVSCDDHHYLYIALRLTYDLRLTSKTRVSMLLREIFLCEGSLYAIFSVLYDSNGIGRADGNIRTYTLYPTTSTFERSAFEFFVTSICPLQNRDAREIDELKYTPVNALNKKFRIRGDYTTPLQAATTFGDPELVLLLLRHGADPLMCYRGANMDLPMKSPVGFTIDTLNISTMLKSSTLGRRDLRMDFPMPIGETIQRAVQCLKYFSRAAFFLDIRESSQTVDTTSRVVDYTLKETHFEVRPSVTEVIDLASFRQPPLLRHACRCVIRDAVSRAGKEAIPQGVKDLQLPSAFIQFLDLQC